MPAQAAHGQDDGLPDVVGTERRAHGHVAAVGKGVVLDGEEERRHHVRAPIGRAVGDEKDRDKAEQLRPRHDGIARPGPDDPGQKGGKAHARREGKHRVQVRQRFGRFALDQAEEEEHEVARLRVAEHAAVQKVGKRLEHAADQRQRQKDVQRIPGPDAAQGAAVRFPFWFHPKSPL